MHSYLWVANYYNQDAAVKAVSIKRLTKQMIIHVVIDKVKAHRERQLTFKQNPGPYIIHYYDGRVKEVKMRVNERGEWDNIRYFVDYALLYKGKVISQSINKMIWIIDAVEEERWYINDKFKSNTELIDLRVRENILRLKLIPTAIKWWYGMNLYRERDWEVNGRIKIAEYSRYSKVEIWDHIVQCRSTINLKVKFIINMCCKIERG